jgi:hypothetical protein
VFEKNVEESFFFSLFSLTHCFEKWLTSGIQRAKEYLEQANVAFSPTSFFVNVELDKQQFNAGRLIKAMSDVSFPEGNLSKILASVRCLTFSFSLVFSLFKTSNSMRKSRNFLPTKVILLMMHTL